MRILAPRFELVQDDPLQNKCNRFGWFALFFLYLKFKTFAMYSREVAPGITDPEFERIWPRLLDCMLNTATEQAVEHLAREVPPCRN